MNHIALYRSWRPQAFRDIVGQQHITQTLQNALREGRFTHAYLFNGPRGTGKTSAAKVFAKAVNCDQGPSAEPCNECDACKRITSGAVMDVVEIDAASNRGVEEIRDIRDKVKYAPTEVRYKVYIIDEVHMLTTEAFNALLKTLEEPPAHVIFILATTEPHKLPATIISRCQRFDFHRVSLEDQINRIRLVCEQENLTAEDEAVQYIARISDGGMRDALSLLDQISSFSDGVIKYTDVISMTGGVASDQYAQLANAIVKKDIGEGLQIIDQLMKEGKSAERCIEGFIHYFRDLLVVSMAPDFANQTQHFKLPEEQLSQFKNTQLFKIIEILNRYQGEMKYAAQPRTLFEVAMMKLCSLHDFSSGESNSDAAAGALSPQFLQQIKTLEDRVAELEQRLTSSSGSSTSRNQLDPGRSPLQAEPKLSQAVKNVKGLGINFDPFLYQRDDAGFKALISAWGQVLNQVKDQKITVHAWLVDGEPVSVTEDSILVAFKNTIHRETTEKPANKQLIEQVLEKLLQKPLKLVTVMQKDWKQASDSYVDQPTEELTLEPEPSEQGKHKEDWINEAIELFGEELVTIKDES
jgi:DNA polymerase-3 subunit gamma/tau